MPVITLYNGIFCNEEAVARDVVESTGYRLVTDDIVAAGAAELSGIKINKIKKTFSSKTSVFNKFTHEKERSMAYVKLAVAKMIENEDLIIQGYAGLLIPRTISHALRVCLIARMIFRQELAQKNHKLSEKESISLISQDDHDRSEWTSILYSASDPWDETLYDIVIPMGRTNPAKAGALIQENLLSDALRRTDESKAAAADFLLAAETGVKLVNAGHNVGVSAQNGKVVLTINRQVLMLSRLEEELKSITSGLPGVMSVETRVGESFHESQIYRKTNFELPSKVLLVDDEREFVQTLSERLQMRDMGSAIAYDGTSAMDLVKNDDPEVMIIDLKMPGMDGMEILKQVKQTKPKIEVIILTGHGSDHDRQKCMDLGAFAYMQKPIDINVLSQTLKQAHEKIRSGQ
ncbi:MAG: response regulator [Desulfobacteraceae bacterium]|nr:response regulator [Desulfobacteraceae bacterium]